MYFKFVQGNFIQHVPKNTCFSSTLQDVSVSVAFKANELLRWLPLPMAIPLYTMATIGGIAGPSSHTHFVTTAAPWIAQSWNTNQNMCLDPEIVAISSQRQGHSGFWEIQSYVYKHSILTPSKLTGPYKYS